jgi:hypothetical protein
MEELTKFIRKQRNVSFNESNQLSLGEIIEKLEKCGLTHGEENEPKTVDYDFATAIPTFLDSWRGSYDELALGFKLSGYDNDEEHFAQTKAEDLLSELKSAIGKTFTGWKGGEYKMTKNTPVWVANSGNVNNTGIIDVIDDGYRIILMTAYCEF